MMVTRNNEIKAAQLNLRAIGGRRANPAEVFNFTRELLKDGTGVDETKRRLMHVLLAEELQGAADISQNTDEPDQVQAIVRIASKILNQILLMP